MRPAPSGPRLQELLPQFLVPTKVVDARIPWNKPRTLQSLSADEDFTVGWSLDRSVSPVELAGWNQSCLEHTR